MYHDKLFVIAKDKKPKPLSENLKMAQAAFGISMPVQGINFNAQNNNSYAFYHIARNRDSKDLWYWDEWEHDLWAYVDPYSSEVLKVEDKTFEFFRFVLALHWSLLLREDIGQLIVGTATLIFILILVTGLVLWWPQNKKAFKIRTCFRWKPATRWKRKNYDLHNILGFYSMFIALTGLV